MKLLALKIDVDTYRGTREGVPRLVELLQRMGADATFLFSLGPDHTGRAIKRVFRPGFMKKVSRTSVVEHYGIQTLLYGTLLPGPDIGRRCADILRSVAAGGFEVGIHTWDHIKWQDYVAGESAAWTREQIDLAADRFAEVFGTPAKTHGAAGWQMNPEAYRHQQRMALTYASDTRGTHPFWPVVKGEPVRCVQLPTTLPTLDELIGVGDLTPDNVHEHLLKLTAAEPEFGHVYTLHAELEGMKLLPAFERLLQGWQAQGYKLVSTLELFNALDTTSLPYHSVEMGELEGRSGTLALQGPRFPV
ncbi:polysaccharide deacetylase family protein [Iodobacter sp.]|uniref:polysaccharide deacetylase family protein n=1 Tax=Iodobacter sp. TaxID=1915058 RepID=UPI0025F2D1CE|nr:polysaccharide deacetylase family protein [Iodobacter sp.]